MNTIYFKCTKCDHIEPLYIQDSVWDFSADNLQTTDLYGVCNNCLYY